MFGGNKAEAIKMLNKAISIDPSSDAAATAYIWLAAFKLDQKRFAEARAAIAEGLRLEPDRLYAQIMSKRIAADSAK